MIFESGSQVQIMACDGVGTIIIIHTRRYIKEVDRFMTDFIRYINKLFLKNHKNSYPEIWKSILRSINFQ